MRSHQQKALDMLEELATTNGIELVTRHYADGSGFTLMVQVPNSLHTYGEVIVASHDNAESIYRRGKAAIGEAVAKIEGGD
jgi:hypothetical protein